MWETMEDVFQLRPGDQGNDSVRSLRDLGKMKDAKGDMVPISPHSHQLYDLMWRRRQVDVYEVPLTRRNLVLARYVHSTPLRCPTRSFDSVSALDVANVSSFSDIDVSIELDLGKTACTSMGSPRRLQGH